MWIDDGPTSPQQQPKVFVRRVYALDHVVVTSRKDISNESPTIRRVHHLQGGGVSEIHDRAVFSYKLRYIVGFGLVETAISDRFTAG